MTVQAVQGQSVSAVAAELGDLPIDRGEVEEFRIEIAGTGVVGTEARTSTVDRNVRAPRWPDVRDYLLTLLGRRNTPPTEVDRDGDDLIIHGGIFSRQGPIES